MIKEVRAASSRGHWCTDNGMDCTKELTVCSSLCDLEKILSLIRIDLLKPWKISSFCLFIYSHFWDSSESKRFTNFRCKACLHCMIISKQIYENKLPSARNRYTEEGFFCTPFWRRLYCLIRKCCMP